MEGSVVLAVLFGALLHASWNALVKSGGDKDVDVSLVHLSVLPVVAPLLLWLPLPPVAAWPYLAISLATHIAYYVTLTGAYRHGELGSTYPIMRGCAPLLVALGSTWLVGEGLSALAWLGTLAITAGVLAVGLAHPGQALHHGRAMAFALANSTVIACYTLADGQGVRATVAAGMTPASYVVTLFVLNGLPYAIWVWARADGPRRRQMLVYARHRWPLASVGGFASLASYGIALWAMTRAPVAVVSALRETSVLFATALSVLVLKERFGVQRMLGAVVILGGVVALRLS